MNKERQIREHTDKEFNVLSMVLRKVIVFCPAWLSPAEKKKSRINVKELECIFSLWYKIFI